MSSLLLIDLQQDFLTPARISPRPFIDSLPHLLRQFTTRRRPIVWIDSLYEQGHDGTSEEEDTPSQDPSQSDFESYLSGTHRSGRFCIPNTPGIQVHEKLRPFIHAHHVHITKTSYSAFTNTTLHSSLQKSNTKHIFLAGVTTNTCVSATAVDARKLGYEVMIIEDCVKAFKQENHDRAILALTGNPYNINLCSSNTISSHLDIDIKLEPPLPVLYWVNGSIPSWRVMIALAWKKIPYISKRLKVMTEPKETRSPEFAVINPRCKTPTFVDRDGTIVIESLAILQYLERFYPADTVSDDNSATVDHLSNKSEWTREAVRFHESDNPHNIYEPIELLYEADGESKHRETILQAYHDIFQELSHWEGYLTTNSGGGGGGGFLSANRSTFGLADCAFYPILAYMVHRGLDLTKKFSGLSDYYQRCGKLQAVREACPDHWETPGKSLFLKCEKMLRE